jgi:hypothetical protein
MHLLQKIFAERGEAVTGHAAWSMTRKFFSEQSRRRYRSLRPQRNLQPSVL